MKKLILALAAVLAALCLASCDTMSAEDFYALPQLSDTYLELQARINQMLDSGAEYAAPTSGSNRQAVQLQDVDGDGVNEALAFFSVSGSNRPLKIVLFRNDGDTYTEIARIEGEGSGFDSVSCLDLDGDGAKEICVGWRIASGMNMLSVYTMRDFSPSDILDTEYTYYTTYDLDGDGNSNLVVFRLASASVGEAEMYTLKEDGEMERAAVRLSADISALHRVRTGRLADERPAVLVEGDLSGGTGLVTDILAVRGGQFTNITLDEKTGTSDTARTMQVFCRDINGDDVLDVPQPEPLPQLAESTYYKMKWYDYRLNGTSTLVCTTYNNNTDSWYLILPTEWTERITVRRQDAGSGERAVVFSYIGEGVENARDFLTIYTFTGENREERAGAVGRFILRRDDEKIYAAAILDTKTGLTVDEETIKQNFRILYSEWRTGET